MMSTSFDVFLIGVPVVVLGHGDSGSVSDSLVDSPDLASAQVSCNGDCRGDSDGDSWLALFRGLA
jgi:hypothetical protein